MSWFQDLAGKAESILNKIDQNAATVLTQKISDKHDPVSTPNDHDLQEVKCEKLATTTLTPIREKLTPKKMLSLKRSPIIENTTQPVEDISVVISGSRNNDENDDDEFTPIINNDGSNEILLPQSNSNSTSRRSSQTSQISSYTDGTVIEKLQINQSTKIQSQYSIPTDGLEQELRALKIVLNQIEGERDEARAELEILQDQIKNANTRTIIKELEELCVQLREDKMALIQK